MPILNERGYLIPAINTANNDYTACAQQLAHSIKAWHPAANICLLTNQLVIDPVFDHVIQLPHGDQDPDSNWKLSNDWQVFSASPFRQTIKLEADMFIASPIDHWWSLFEHRDIVISQGCRDFYDHTSNNRFYRRVFDKNQLPDVYNGITYWRVSHAAKTFFDLVRKIFENWDQFKKLLKFAEQDPTTDVVYAVAAVILGPDTVTLPPGYGPTMVHMKKHIIPTRTSDWTQELVWEHTDPGLRINTIAQWGAVHYHIKDWRIQ